MTDAVIVSAVRTAVGRAPKGALRHTRPDDLAAIVLREALARVPAIDAAEVEDVVIGCAMPEGEQGLNVARIASLRAGLPISSSAVTVNRFCASGLEAIAIAADRVRSGAATVALAGGTESMSLIPMGGRHVSPNPTLVSTYPDAYLTTGLVAENHVRDKGISREAQDAFALQSHTRAVAAADAGRFAEEIVPVEVMEARFPGAMEAGSLDPASSGLQIRSVRFDRDEGPRRDTSAAALAKLAPAFHAHGTVTAGNSSQTSDGAAAVVVMSADRARALGITPLARFAGYATAGVAPERFGLGPVPATRKLLGRLGLKIEDLDLIEMNEAFAAQVLACLDEMPVDPARLNVNGGAIALGHPLGCSGAKLTATLLYEMRRRQARYGLVTMCIGGGMGAAAILERWS